MTRERLIEADEADEADEAALKLTAELLGPKSPQALALAERDRRKAEGEDVAIFQLGVNMLGVGPRSLADQYEVGR